MLTKIMSGGQTVPLDRRGQLLQWLIEMDKRDWDNELEEDFSGKGLGVPLLNHKMPSPSILLTRPLMDDPFIQL